MKKAYSAAKSASVMREYDGYGMAG